jgi:hypothetical protein
MDETFEEGIAIGMGCEQTMGDATLSFPTDGLGNAAVEAFDQAIGLRAERLGEPVFDVFLGADAIEGMVAGGFTLGLSFHIDGEAVGEFGTIVGEDGVHRGREMRQEALQERSRSLAVAAGMDLDIDVTRRPVDGERRSFCVSPAPANASDQYE